MSPSNVLITVVVWLAVVAAFRFILVPRLRRGPGHDVTLGSVWWLVRAYARLWHRPTFTGTEIIPENESHGGLIVVSNHTGAVDPLLIQARCPFLITWMMAAEMMSPRLQWLWDLGPILPVARDGTDSRPLREAIKRVKGGAAVGIFPEGRITTPPREIRPFLRGAGLIITRTRVPVLLVWVSGTPDTNRMGEGLSTRSNARVAFVEMMEFPGERDPAVVAERLRHRLAKASGWPLNDEMLPPGGSGAGGGDARAPQHAAA